MLWESDYVYFEGDVVWDPAGMIGIGSAGGEGEAVFHLDNFIEENPMKRIYLEATVINFSPGGPESFWGPPYLNLPMGFQEKINYWNYMWTSLDQGIWLLDMWFMIEPNPPWEDIFLPFFVPEGEEVWFDDLHIATECVPIPGAVWLLGSGLVGLVGLRRKFKK